MSGVQDFVLKKKDYLLTQVGNPEGADKPNKKVTRSRSGRASLIAISSSTTLVFGSVRAKRRSRSVSRSHAETLATSVSGSKGALS